MSNMYGKDKFHDRQKAVLQKSAQKIENDSGWSQDNFLRGYAEEILPASGAELSFGELCAIGEQVEQEAAFSAKEAMRNKIKAKPALFTNFRIKRDTVPDGLYAYDVRHDDDCRGIPCEIAPFIMINHWGTIILAEPLELPNDGRRYIDEETDWNYDPFGGAEKNQKPCVTVEEFMNQYLNR